MQPIDFRYRMSDQGRVVLGSLSSEETLEFEVLSQRDREGVIDLPNELRLLELYVKYHSSNPEVPLAPLEPLDDLLETPLPRTSSRRAPEQAYVVAFVAVLSVGFIVIAMLIN
ncbi:hypothetical protein JQ621_27435 [Bradyrhizobium manausense]|uniref:hypothetical protein n=1 Tax=Bradyrhizobium manausense TaxID=989370 RepID=UPI001BA6945E|nr:hypothetical protein [Bradyrhizobium manausense]MBR1091207.1 hypothetical protein [Bradyrhizobium manausense]